MAAEIKITGGISLTKGNLTLADEPGTLEVDMSGTRYASGVQDIGNAAHEILVTGDVGTAGWAWFVNLDEAINIDLGVDSAGTFVAFATLFPRERFPVPLKTKNVYAKAASGTPKLKYIIVER